MSGNIPGLTVSQGWLPYGSTDASIIFQHPLTSRPVSNSAGTPGSGNVVPYTVGDATNPAGGGPKYDSVLGILCSDIATNNSFRGGLVFSAATFSAAINYALAFQGQISFQVEALGVTSSEPTYFSQGYSQANYAGTSPTLLRLTGAGGNGNDSVAIYAANNSTASLDLFITPGSIEWGSQGYTLKGNKLLTTDASQTGQVDFVGNAGTGFQNARALAAGGPTGQVHSFGKNRFVDVNLGWVGSPSGGIIFVAVDGLFIGVIQRGNAAPPPAGHSFLEQFNLGVGLTSGDATGAPSFYMRNLQISSAAPRFLVKPGFYRVAFWGDSTTPLNSQGWDIHFGGNGDLNSMRVIQKGFQNIGYLVETFGSQNSGNTIDDKSNTPDNTTLSTWKNSIFPQGKFDAALSTYNPPTVPIPGPDIVILRGGVNDIAADLVSGSTYQNPPVVLQDSRFLASLDRLVNFIMWNSLTNAVVTGGTRTSVKHLILMTPQSPRWAANGWGSGPKPAAVPGSLPYAYNYVYTTLLNYPARWNSRYPSLPNLVSVADYAAFIGGDNYLFSGPPGAGSGAPPYESIDGVHPAIAGSLAIGQCALAELLRLFALS